MPYYVECIVSDDSSVQKCSIVDELGKSSKEFSFDFVQLVLQNQSELSLLFYHRLCWKLLFFCMNSVHVLYCFFLFLVYRNYIILFENV